MAEAAQPKPLPGLNTESRITEDLLLQEFNGDKDAVARFRRFQRKDLAAQARGQIEEETQRLLATPPLEDEYDKAYEKVTKVFRKAWAQACKNLILTESEFPCKY